jgi:hypothetical protein
LLQKCGKAVDPQFPLPVVFPMLILGEQQAS